ESFAEAHGLRPGDRFAAIINERKRTLIVAGTALSPEFVYAIAPGQLVPDNRRFAVLWMDRAPLEAAFDLDGAFNQVCLSLQRGADESEVIDRLDRLLDRYGGTGAFGRRDHVSHAYLDSEMKILREFGQVAPPIFLIVAAFLLHVVIGRLVATEREQIGLLKAVGYTNNAIALHYLKMAAIIGLMGTLAGVVAGTWLGEGMTAIYTQFFRFPFLHYRLDPAIVAGACLLALSAALVGAYNAARRAARLPPAIAMRPASPTDYRSAGLDGLVTLARLDQPTVMILRHIWRWPRRAALTVLGMALGVAVLVGATFTLDSIEEIVDSFFFLGQRQDLSVNFTETRPTTTASDIGHLPGVLKVEGYRSVPARLIFGHRERRIAITGLSPGNDLQRPLDESYRPIGLPPKGLVLTDHLAALLGAGRGDILQIEVLEGRRPSLRVPVSQVAKEYIGLAAYMDLDALNRLLGERPLFSSLHLAIDNNAEERLFRALKEIPAVAGVTMQTEALRTFRSTMAETINIMIGFYMVFAALIAFGVVYNSARITLSERARELASLCILGFSRAQASYILLGEVVLLGFIALPLGCVLGYGLAWLMSMSYQTDLYRVPLVVEPATFGLAVLVVLIAGTVSALAVAWRITELDLIEVLKTRE
ncbi:MAG: FtsX-like permease family protein, partial [Alphaproteobacteria bacterium]|nr:FtsX-like permease family protein [Alphaproteobacteria bacterium]